MSIESRITAIEEHIGNAYDGLEDLGVDLTNINKNINNIKACLDNVYSAYPKVTGSGKEVVLSGTKKARMEVVPKGESEQESTNGNQLYILPPSGEVNGITYTNNGDGTCDIVGTASASTDFALSLRIPINEAPITLGTSYNISVETALPDVSFQIVEYNSNQGWLATQGLVRNAQSQNITIPNNSDIAYIDFNVRVYEGAIVNARGIKLMMNTGTSRKTFEQFTGGIPAPSPDFPFPVVNVTGNNSVEVQNKNLFDKSATPVAFSNTLVTELNNGIRVSNTTTGNNNNVRYLIKDLLGYEGKTIRIKCNAKSSSTNPAMVYLRIINGDGSTNSKYGAQVSSTTLDGELDKSYTIPSTLDSEGHYLSVAFYGTREVSSSVGSYVDYTNIIVTIDNEDMTYVPYSHQTKPLNLGSSKLMKNDYMSDDGIHHKRGQYVLTGNETVTINNTGTNTEYFKIIIPKKAKFVTGVLPNALSTNYIAVINDTQYFTETGKFTISTSGDLIITNKSYSTVEDFKTYLAQQYTSNTPVIVEYELNEEETEAYTTEQQTQWNNLKQTNSYDDTTIVTTTYSNAQADLTVSALKGA